MAVVEQLENLWKLQQIEGRIGALEAEAVSIPEVIRAAADALEKERGSLAEERERFEGMEKRRRSLESDLTAEGEQIKKWQGQLLQIKTNKDYTTMLAQIENTKAACGAREEQILQLMEDIERLEDLVREKKSSLEQEEMDSKAKKQSLEEKLTRVRGELENAKKVREAIRSAIEPEHLGRYETLARKHRDGTAVAVVVSGVCRGCMRDLPPETYNLLFRHDRILSCPNCQRVLHFEETIK